LIPFLSLYLAWQKMDQLIQLPFMGNWWGVALAAAGLVMYFLGELSTLFILVNYAFLVVLMGAIWAIWSSRAMRLLIVPLSFLFFMIPLPVFLYNGLSAKLQLWSSSLGVALIRLFDISVYLEGNVIDLGTYQLQVVEACSGLRYLFPLMSLAFICATLYSAAFWKKAVVFLSSIPVTVAMNSLRIGMIGILVDRYGKSMAEGFLHDFEGWIVFMVCTAILVGEMWLLSRIGPERKPFQEIFGFVVPESLPEGIAFAERKLPKQYAVVLALLTLALAGSLAAGKREEEIPARRAFVDFPQQLGVRHGVRRLMDEAYIETLKFSDYELADYYDAENGPPVNLYVAYYASQRKGASVHSPKSCIPGGGWEMQSLTDENIPLAAAQGGALPVKRTVIAKGRDKQLVYYWFQQRGRTLTNEYLLKWYVFADALGRNRTDGALVRLTTPIAAGEDVEKGDARLRAFLGDFMPILNQYIPD
jgi:exosortase D (VPLPA-CTERM-specific)